MVIAPAANAQSVAEQTIALMLATARNLTMHDRAVRAGLWNRNFAGIQVSGRTLGLVGLGDIGTRVAKIAHAIGMKVVAFDPALNDKADIGLVTRAETLDALLPQANILSIHCPLNAATRGMIGARELALLPKDAIVINTARGSIIDETAFGRGAHERAPVRSRH